MNKPRLAQELSDRAKSLKVLKIEYVPIDSIKPNAYNPNRMQPSEFSMLKKSITDDGMTQPVIVQSGVREIVDGEHRWRACKELGYQEVPVVFVEMTEAQRRIATLRHNRARGVEDFDLATQVFRELRDIGALDFAKDALEMDDVEMNRMLSDLNNQTIGMGSGIDDIFNSSPVVPGSPVIPSAPGQAAGATPSRPMTQTSSTALLGAPPTPAPEEDKDPFDGVASAANPPKEDVYRLALVFTGEEARDVAAVLEPRMASNLLQLCRAELARKKS